MVEKLKYWWQETWSSFWFLPLMIVLAGIILGAGLVWLEARLSLELESWPLLFGVGADGSRELLSAVAGSMITVAGVVFSITIVALSLTSSQYTSRVLRTFMKDRVNQAVLGVFVGIFAYCLVVLRTIRGGDEGSFVPSLAVLGGLLLAFLGIAFLIYFIHHIARSIQASNIIAAAAKETFVAVDRLFPQELGEDADENTEAEAPAALAEKDWFSIESQQTGYIQSIDTDALVAAAQEQQVIFRMDRGIGEFVIEGMPLISIAAAEPAGEAFRARVNALYVIDRQRTLYQDAAFGIRQIVDIAIKALSPGVNDSTTAVMCVDYLGAILARLAARRIVTPYRTNQGVLRVIARGPSFEALLAESFDQIRVNAEGNVTVLTRLVEALENIARMTVNSRRKVALRRHAELICELAKDAAGSAWERARVDGACARLASALGDGIDQRSSSRAVSFQSRQTRR